jgi:hypothetical protein
VKTSAALSKRSWIAALMIATLFTHSSAPAQFNSWTKTSSGSWEEPFWSLGVLPSTSQSGVLVTNEGWKAVAITATTARDYPDSLKMNRLTVLSPANTFNTLLLNHAGVASPVEIGDFLRVGSNSAVVALSSALHVRGAFFIDGAMTQAEFSEVNADIVYLGEFAPGIYTLSNGVLTVSNPGVRGLQRRRQLQPGRGMAPDTAASFAQHRGIPPASG